ncbi:hypothetical protein OJ997_29765 [Solirubrobacter phytolaccae]|uniref:Uncharacterized protein n=1 Tax=Solirubrobacter phytolaccae TaxID=1404360 RepID=A0A9X3NNA4_9ACTN|nr:hypothetical protein [Solirubrobacter phytolaccae]MDA0184527.1 hypothetical protein [Solirubrobacter phytolaccae]
MRPLLREAVAMLARAPEEQAAAVAGACVDELALDLDAQPWHDESADVRAALDELDGMLDAMSGEEHARLWTIDALHGAEWHQVRRLARRVLALDGVEPAPSPPHLPGE